MASEGLRKFRLRRASLRVAKKSGLTPLAEKADHLEAIKKAVEDAAAVSGGLWLSYLFALFYIAVAAGAVTHEDLLLVRAVKLPFLNIELPLLAFFAIAPFLFVITHANALLHFKMLGFKALRYDEALRRRSSTDQETRDKLRRLLPSNILVHIFAGPPESRRGVFGVILILAAVTSLVVLPIALLLLLQFQFLPYHDVAITQAQRVALATNQNGSANPFSHFVGEGFAPRYHPRASAIIAAPSSITASQNRRPGFSFSATPLASTVNSAERLFGIVSPPRLSPIGLRRKD